MQGSESVRAELAAWRHALVPHVWNPLAYQRSDLRGDVFAALTVTAYLVPQVMAYAALAGVPPQTGLWVIVVTLVVYAFTGSSRLLSVGPESTTALLTAATLGPLADGDPVRYASLAALLAMLVGLFALVAWLIRLGFVGDLISKPVLVGYIAGVAIIMVVSQLDTVTGTDTPGDTLIQQVASFVSNVGDNNIVWANFAIGLAVAFLSLVFSARAHRLPMPLVAVVAAAVVTALFDLERFGVITVSDTPSTLPVIGIPMIAVGDIALLLLPAVGILVVAYADNLLTARMLTQGTHDRVRNNQELFALGSANIAAGLISGFPISSSASRSIIAKTSGATSQMYSLMVAGLVVLVLLLLTPLLTTIPLAALGGLVIYAAIKLVDVKEFARLWRFRFREFALAIAATIGVLAFDILYGVLTAIALSVLEMLTRVARPHAATLGYAGDFAGWHDVEDYPGAQQLPGLLVYRYDSPLFFANADNFAKRCEDVIEHSDPKPSWFLLNMEGITDVDITGLDALERVRVYCSERGIVFAVARLKLDVQSDLETHGVASRIGLEHFYPRLPVAIDAYKAARGISD